MKNLFFSRSLFGLLFAALFFVCGSSVRAATLTVCASGCTDTSIATVLVTASEGDVVEVMGGGGSPYDPTSETWPILFPHVSSTLVCTGGATIGRSSPTGDNSIYLSTSSTVSGCTFGNVSLRSMLGPGASSARGLRIVDNTFSASATGTVEFGTAVEDFELRGNVNLNYLALSSTSTNGLVQGNTFYARLSHLTNPVLALSTSASSSMIRVIGNTFTSQLTSSDYASSFVKLDGYDLVFATNTLRYAVTPPAGIETTVVWNASGTNYFGGNFIDAPSNFGSCSGLYITQPRNNRWVSTSVVTHNTIRLTGDCTSGVGINFGTYIHCYPRTNENQI